MELNIITLLYLFFRLAPFIIVCYFSLSSLFNQDIKGLIYLVGLLFACFATFLIGQAFPISFTFGEGLDKNAIRQVNPVCNLITIGKDGSFSKIPLGISILTYTLIYLVYIIVTNDLVQSNLPTIIFFPILITADLLWTVKNDCYKPFGVVLAIIVGGLMGWGWAAMIDTLNNPNLFFLNTGSNQTVCSRPKKTLFKCTFPQVAPTNQGTLTNT
jgi:hypothetical protein